MTALQLTYGFIELWNDAIAASNLAESIIRDDICLVRDAPHVPRILLLCLPSPFSAHLILISPVHLVPFVLIRALAVSLTTLQHYSSFFMTLEFYFYVVHNMGRFCVRQTDLSSLRRCQILVCLSCLHHATPTDAGWFPSEFSSCSQSCSVCERTFVFHSKQSRWKFRNNLLLAIDCSGPFTSQ